MSTNERFIDGLAELLTATGTPIEWLDSERVDLKNLFIRLKESGRISGKVYDHLVSSFTEKPAHYE